MSNLFTCIECGHYPVSSRASKCPKCSKNPLGHTCKFCNQQVADSQAVVDHEFDDDSIRNYYYFHSSCLKKINTIQYNCPSCSMLNTSFHHSCVKCGHPFEARYKCTYCRQFVIDILAIKGVGILGKHSYLHRICAEKIRPNWEVEEAKARAEENRKREAQIQVENRKREQEKEKLQEEKKNANKRRIEKLIYSMGTSAWLSLAIFSLTGLSLIAVILCIITTWFLFHHW